MQLGPQSAAHLVGDRVAFAGFVDGKHGPRCVVDHMHAILFIPPVPVRGMVIRVIPAPHRKATVQVPSDIERLVDLLNAKGLSVELVCTDGDSSYVRKLA